MNKLRSGIRKWFHSVWARALVCLTLSMIPLFLLGFAISSWSRNTMSEQITALNTAQVTSGMRLLTAEIDKLSMLESTLLFDKDINRLGVMPGFYTKPQETQAILRAQERMAMLTDSSTIVSSAFLLVPSIGKMVTNTSVDDIDGAFLAAADALCVSRPRVLLQIGAKHYLMMAYPTYQAYLKNNGALYIIGAEVDGAALHDRLEGMLSRQDEFALLLDAGGAPVASAGAYDDMPSLPALSARAKNERAFDLLTEGGRRCSVVAAEAYDGQMTLIKGLSYESAFKPLATQRALFLLLLVLVVAANLAYAVYLWHSLHKPLQTLSGAFGRLETGELSTRIHHSRDDDFSDIYHRFNRMSRRLEELIEQVYLQKIRVQQAELKQLQSQINPHFLYNSFFMLKAFARMHDDDSIERIVGELGEYYRYVTRNGESEVTLEAETAHARNYAAIQDVRFGKRVKLDFGLLPERMKGLVVPRLILQPLVENAYGHGLSDMQENGLLRVRFFETEDAAVIQVEDNGTGMTQEKLDGMRAALDGAAVTQTTGLVNIHHRIRLRFGAPWGITPQIGEWGGLRVTLSIPRAED